jgi:hypothetical protein
MTRTLRLAIVVATGACVSVALALSLPTSDAADLAALGTAIVAGELLELRPVDRPALPISIAFIGVVLRASSGLDFVLIVSAAYLVAAAIRVEPKAPIERAFVFLERTAGALLAAVVYQVILEATRGADTRASVLAALAATATTQIFVYDVVTATRRRRLMAGGIAAEIALVTSATLMAVSYGGIAGKARLGLWGPGLFVVLLLAAWYSFELLASTRRNLRQTVRALGSAPELGGLVRPGHTERVAELAAAMGRELEFSPTELDNLETAAFLHHLGVVCLDEPEPGSQHEPVAVAEAGAEMLRASEVLAPAGDIVAAEPLLHRPSATRESAPAALAGQVLKVASAFDELTEGHDEHAAWAVDALFTGPSYVYDGRVLDALERVAVRRGLLVV